MWSDTKIVDKCKANFVDADTKTDDINTKPVDKRIQKMLTKPLKP